MGAADAVGTAARSVVPVAAARRTADSRRRITSFLSICRLLELMREKASVRGPGSVLVTESAGPDASGRKAAVVERIGVPMRARLSYGATGRPAG
ncbi:hypothetical protein GCM10010270_66340 [Streptomyces violaceus]|nr:hypothetical protein GCM10010270_66340 [Streptomyces janthinus]